MTVSRIVIASAALSLTFSSAPVLAQTSPAFERAILGEMDPATRADVEKRATGGNTVGGVVGTILINNYHAAGAKNPGEALTVIALDFERGVAVLGTDERTFEIIHFDPKTLRLKP
jgi:hypothetical protein